MLDIFAEERWAKIQDSYELWWRRETDRPLLHLAFYGDSRTPAPEGLVTEELFRYPRGEPADTIAEKLEYIMRSMRYECDGFPYVWMYFGPVSTVEFFGAKAYVDANTVWYKAENVPPIEKMRVALDKDSVFYPRYREIAAALERRFGGGYAISSSLGGGYCLDMISEFYKPMELCYMLYDKPDEVNRLSMEFHKASCAVGREQMSLTPSARGYSHWGGLFAPVPWGAMQCDFSAMIGPEHFERFVLWDLELAASESPRYNYYHLDGTGQLPHLDSILSIQNLKCVQWVPQAGKPGVGEWPEVYKKISAAKKNMWVLGALEDLETVAGQIGTAKGLYWQGRYHISEYDRVMKIAGRLVSG
ncbi:MAG: hypothetical protein FWD23_17040 [Oscillospiraceae bacterium]|nr:hypothetical protein [Oscillospiraceae bacterium]